MNDVGLIILLALMIGYVILFMSYKDLKKEIKEMKEKYDFDKIKFPTPPKTMDDIIRENLDPEDLERLGS